jgi:poly [ADP-ribose] polymerase
MSGVVREAKYIKSDLRKNNNKFWYITEFDNATVETHWGRVGDDGQRKTKDFPSQGAATTFFDKKCKEKERAGRNGEIAYRPLQTIEGGEGAVKVQSKSKKVGGSRLKEIAKKQIKTNNPTVAKLIDYLTKVNAHNITTATGGQLTFNDTTGLFSTPLGIVTQDAIDDANDILVEVGDMVVDGDYGRKMANRTNDFLMLVPQDIGRKRLDVRVFWRDLAAVQKQKAIVDSLQASLVTATSDPKRKKTAKSKPEDKVFDVQLFLVQDSKVISRIKKKYRQTCQSMHQCSHLKVKTVYTVQIATMKDAFDSDGSKVGNVMELWHGTRASNLLSILKGGLIIPPSTSSNVTGRMFGDGLYFSDQSTKSLNYAYGYWGGGGRDSNCFMFLADVAMGKYFVPRGATRSLPMRGYDSTFAKASKSGVYNNEMIVYKVSQANLTYLIEFAP